MIRALAFLTFFANPVIAETSLEQIGSADLVAEINFLSDLLPPTRRLSGNDRQAFEYYLAAQSICDGLTYEEYAVFADGIAATFDGDVEMRLGQRSYSVRSDEGCDVDPNNQQIVESYVGAIEIRRKVLEALRVRREEMLQRTLFQED